MGYVHLHRWKPTYERQLQSSPVCIGVVLRKDKAKKCEVVVRPSWDSQTSALVQHTHSLALGSWKRPGHPGWSFYCPGGKKVTQVPFRPGRLYYPSRALVSLPIQFSELTLSGPGILLEHSKNSTGRNSASSRTSASSGPNELRKRAAPRNCQGCGTQSLNLDSFGQEPAHVFQAKSSRMSSTAPACMWRPRSSCRCRHKH
jgi:hypothetical protein